MFKQLFTGAAVAALTVSAAYAQETTSAVRGDVRAETGEPIAGAQVTITHGPTGSVASEGSDNVGVFDLRGLRIGGPYTIEVVADGYEGQRLDNVFLEVGVPFEYEFALTPSVNEIIVTAIGGRSAAVGSSSLLNRDDIAGAVSISRDIRDLARRDPLVSQNSRGDQGISIAGSNPRTNRITIDGVQAQDDYGLNTGGLPTRRGPVSLDAVSQFSVEAAPFDVENGDFIGGAINIVLAEGGNSFEGSAFTNFLNEGLLGTRIDGVTVDNTITQENYGASLRGPILPGRLFFALSGETYSSADASSTGPAGGGFASGITGPNGVANSMTAADIAAVTNVFTTIYGSTYPLGSIPLTKPVTDEKYTGRFDFDITDDHRATFTLRHSESGVIQRTNINSTTAGLDSQWYLTGEDDYTTAFQLNSNWSDRLSSEFRISLRDYTRLQEPPAGQEFADIRVCSTPTNVDASTSTPQINCRTAGGQTAGSVRFGADQFRHANFLHTENRQAQASAEYQLGDHLLKAGAQWQNTEVFNLFVQDSEGTYYFDSIAQFAAGRASQLIYNNSLTGDPNDAAAAFDYDVNTVFASDTWDVTDDLTLSAGLRYDWYTMSDEPALNDNFVNRFGYDNQTTYDGLDVLMPRLSFTYDATSDLRISGGVGLFSGGLPDVFLANSFSNTGILTNSLTFERNQTNGPGGTGTLVETTGVVNCANAAAVYGNATLGFYTGPQVCNAALNVPVNANFGQDIPIEVRAAQQGSTAAAASIVNALSPDFEMPSVWKANLTGRWDFHRNFRLGADLFAFQDDVGLAFRDIRAQPLIINGQRALTPDGRLRYDGLTTAQRTAIVGVTPVPTNIPVASNGSISANRDLESFNPGETPFSWIASVSLMGEWDNGVEAGVSYTYQDVEDYSSSARFSSTASSLYGGQFAAFDPNVAESGRGQEEIEDSFKYSFGWRHNFIGDLATRFTLFGEWRSGRPLSFTMNAGGGRNPTLGVNRGSQLAYIPDLSGTLTQTAGAATPSTADDIFSLSSDSTVTFDSATTYNRLVGLVDMFDLQEGRISPRGEGDNPDIHRLDLQISQEFPGLVRSHRTRLTFDIANVLNLLNDEWGVIEEYGESVNLYNVTCAGPNGALGNAGIASCETYRFSGAADPNAVTTARNTDLSRWVIQVGLRYDF